MNKTQMAEKLKKKAGLATKTQAEDVVSAVFDLITESLENGEAVSIHGFGKFEVQHRAARTGRNPATGGEIEIAAKNVPKFKPGKALKDRVAQ